MSHIQYYLAELKGRVPDEYYPKEVCANCKNLYQHYVKNEKNEFSEIFYGHCIYPRGKKRYPGDTCQYFKDK